MSESAEFSGGIGRRLREIRVWRGLSLRAAGELAGFSAAYLSLIERGVRPIERRSTLEALAGALQVSPSELTGTATRAAEDRESGPAVAALRLALADVEFGEAVDAPARPWPDVAADLAAMNALRPQAAYGALGAVLPALVVDLHAHLTTEHRRAALAGLVDCYAAAQFLAKNLGVPDLALVASRHLRDATSALSGPEWAGLAAWSRAQAISQSARDRAHAVATRGAADIASELDRPQVADVYGSLHLTAALASMTLGRTDTAADHLDEAAAVATRPGVGTGFGNLWFSSGNVQVWRTMLAVEAGDGGRAVEIARGVDPATLPESPNRQAAW
ncbi:helix-turn-helix domain-containing protein [Pseudonocardia sp. CA-107938]|uniref:helix-turn-helix domain-containing protein n=1 Tax=Pseudonocardia sp. CA-107938 TaxID=3240021 RepID=UPI003D8DE6A9